MTDKIRYERLFKKYQKLQSEMKLSNKKIKKTNKDKATLEKQRNRIRYLKDKINRQWEYAENASTEIDISAKFSEYETNITFAKKQGSAKEQIKENKNRITNLENIASQQYQKNIDITLAKYKEKLNNSAESLKRTGIEIYELEEKIFNYKDESYRLREKAKEINAPYYKDLFNKVADLLDEEIEALEKILESL